MGHRDRLVRFCPYTTLKKGTSAFEDPLRQRIRGRKTYFLGLIVAISLLTPVAYSIFAEPPIKVVALRDLQVKILTDKREYGVNEPIKATLYICNNYSYPVRIEPIREILFAGNSMSEPEKIAGIGDINYRVQYILIEANSSLVFHEFIFSAKLSGEFQINMLGASTVVNIMEK